jgi:4-amino-4-deoxy-L-arabinose transferase-like glycosyltransferase
MQRRRVQRFTLLLIVVLATVLRVYELKDVPAGFFCDEAGLGYNAYTIASAGVDERGTFFPLYFWSFGVSYKNPAFIYTAAIPVKLLGADEFSVRLTSAVYGIGTVIALFFLGRALVHPWVGVFAGLFLAICPWHLHFSRVAFELISFPFFFVIGFTLLVRYTQGRRTLPAAMFFFGLCPYTYAVANLFVPLFLLGFALLYFPTLLRQWRQSALAFIVLAGTVAPVGVFYYNHQQLTTQYFRRTTNLRAEEDVRTQVERVARYYRMFFSREFLFDRGDPIVRHAVRDHGELYNFYAPFLLLGAAAAALRRDRASKLLLWWLVIYPISPSLMTEIPSASRGFIGVPAFCLLTGLGLGTALRALAWILRWRPLILSAQTAALGVAAYFLVPQVHHYLQLYFHDYPKYSAPTYGGFQYGYRQVIEYMESKRSEYDLLLMTAVNVNQPQVFPLFYKGVDPTDPETRYKTGYLIIDPAEYRRYSMDQRILASLRPTDLDLFSDYTVHRRIVAPGGREEFVIAEVRARKRFLTNWLVLGLFPNEGREGVKHDFIDVRNLRKDRYEGAFGDVFWRPINPQFVRVDLNRFFYSADPRHPGNPELVCAYAAMTVTSPEERAAFVEITGSDDMIQVWLNGRTLTPFAFMLSDTAKRRPVNLRRGDNVLVVKSCENVGGWHFTMRVTDEAGIDLTDLQMKAEIPTGPVPQPASPPRELQLVEGFASIKQFREHAPEHPSYRGPNESWFAQVHHQPGEIVWETAPCAERKPTVFVFTTSTSDERGEAELYVNGNYALTFEMSGDRDVRSWQRGPYHMTFVSKQSIAGNSGIALLGVPADVIEPGKPAELRVIPARGRNEAWFMVKGYRDTIAHEKITEERAAETIRGAWTTDTTR